MRLSAGVGRVADVLLNVRGTHCRGGPERIARCRCGSGVGSGRSLVCRMVKDDQNPRFPSSQNVGHPATLPAGSPLNRRRTALSGHCLPPTACWPMFFYTWGDTNYPELSRRIKGVSRLKGSQIKGLKGSGIFVSVCG